LGDFFTLGSFSEDYRRSPHFSDTFLNALILTRNWFGFLWGDSFTNSPGHPAGGADRCRLPMAVLCAIHSAIIVQHFFAGFDPKKEIWLKLGKNCSKHFLLRLADLAKIFIRC
jgi:hypothetical protein